MTTRPPSPATPPTETPGRVQVVATGSTSTSPLSSSPAAAGLASAAVLPTTATTTTTTTLNSHNNNNNSSSNHANNPTLTNTTTAQAAAAPFPFIPRSYQQASTTATTFGQRFKAAGLPLSFPRLYSGPLFAAPSVSVNHTHIVSSIGPITPPLTIDHSTSSPIPSCSTGGSDTSPPSSTALAAPGKSTTVIPKRQIYKVVHDKDYCMFRITLDNKRIAALCYLPTRFSWMVEFYHTEIPTAYRDLGLGDRLVVHGFQWAETAKLLVIPTCPFVRRYLAKNKAAYDCVVQSENEGLSRLLTPPSSEEDAVVTVE